MAEPKKKSLAAMLGLGLAREAGDRLAERESNLNRQIDAAEGASGGAPTKVDTNAESEERIRKKGSVSSRLGVY